MTPSPSPSDSLSRIGRTAEKGLQRADIRKIPYEPISARLHDEMNQLLKAQANANEEEAEALNTAQLGLAANLSPAFAPDLEITRAPQLENRELARDWPREIRDRKDSLSKKAAIFTTLIEMRDRSGIQENNNLRLMRLVKQAAEAPENSHSVWELFTHEYRLTFTQKLKAGWFYVLFYLTSLVNNTVETYLGNFIDKITDDLTRDNSETRTILCRTILENANQFFIDDVLAIRDFAEGKAHDLQKRRQEAIEKVYGSSLTALCKAFSEHRVDTDSPVVPFLRRFQDVPVLKSLFRGIEWFVNRFLIQRAMKVSILPNALENLVNKGLESTRQQNLPFSIAMTQFVTMQLERLLSKINQKTPSQQGATLPFPGTETLPAAIKNLMILLEFKGPNTATSLELRKKIREMERASQLNETVANQLKPAIIEGANQLFGYLHEAAASGELLANLLELTEKSFSSEERELKPLLAEYTEEQSKLKRTAKTVFETIVRKAVSEKVYGRSVESSQEVAKEVFDDQKAILAKTAEGLQRIGASIREKIEQSKEAPSAANNVGSDIASLLQIMQVFANRKELQQELSTLEPVDQNTIYRTIHPFLDNIEKIGEKALRLQELQDHYPSHYAVEQSLETAKKRLQSLRKQLQSEPRNFHPSLIEPVEQTARDIARAVGEKAPLYIHLQALIRDISERFNKLAQTQQVIHAMHALSIPRSHPDENGSQGLLDQLLNYQRGAPPPGFRLRICEEQIQKYLLYFPRPEKEEIERVLGDGSDLKTKWPALSECLQRIYTKYVHLNTQHLTLLQDRFSKGARWAEEKRLKYQFVRKTDHANMQAEAEAICKQMETLKNQVADLRLSLSPSLSARASKIISFLLPPIGALLPFAPQAMPLIGPYVPPALGYFGPPIGAGLGAALGKAKFYGNPGEDQKTQPPIPEKKRWIVLPKVFKTAAAGFASYLLPPGWSQAGACATFGYFGWQGVKAAQSITEKTGYDAVMKVFDSAYELILDQELYRAAVTRTLKAMTPDRVLQAHLPNRPVAR